MHIIRIENEFGICNLKANTSEEAKRYVKNHKLIFPQDKISIHEIEPLENDPNLLIEYTRRKE